MSWQEELNKKLEAQRQAYKESIKNGTAKKRATSYAASCVSKENRIKKGIIGGNIHKESGHIQRLNDFPREEGQRSEAGKLGGAKNVETGWIKEFGKIGTSAAAEKQKNLRIEDLKIICDNMIADKAYLYSELCSILNGQIKQKRLFNILRCEEAVDFIIKETKGKSVKFKKIWNQEN